MTDDIDTDDVRDHPDMSPSEKEVTIGFSKKEDRARVYSTIGSVSRRLIDHDDAEIEDTTEVDEKVVSVRATVPVGLVLLKGEPRSDNTPSRVVSA